MTREERIEKLRHLITCMKCEVSGKPCDNNCPTQYDAGHMGEIIENLEEIAKALEQEPCEDCISRQAVLDGLARIAKAKAKSDAQKALMGRVMFFTEQLPPITPQPKIGRWIRVDKDKCKCDRCKSVFEIASANGESNFCPNCGADMREVEE